MFSSSLARILNPKRNWKQCLCKTFGDKQGVLWERESSELAMTFLTVQCALFLFFVCLFFISFYFFFHILALEDQLQQAKQHAEQYKSMSEANESALSDLNKVGNKRKVFLAHSRKIFNPT